ncbi:MAG: hypothetical protein CMM84_15040 [Rhodothermaceae bacterium]|nr:hypothetical protein [Rhodothermaceae bacterium]MBC12999.1 hypothetical protein [Rhodothermaceae bacterium]|tara:strand:- start:286 stop:594 length:309 start_codon:yes stop_codon:yes gene_type:complete
MDALSKAIARDFARLVEPIVRDAVRAALPATPAANHPGKGWLTNAEAMEYLGLSRPTLARYRKDGKLPYAKVGSSVFYQLADVEALLAEHLVQSGRVSAPRG